MVSEIRGVSLGDGGGPARDLDAVTARDEHVLPGVGGRRGVQGLPAQVVTVEGQRDVRERALDMHREPADARQGAVRSGASLGPQLGGRVLVARDADQHLGTLDQPPYREERHAEVVGDDGGGPQGVRPAVAIDRARPVLAVCALDALAEERPRGRGRAYGVELRARRQGPCVAHRDERDAEHEPAGQGLGHFESSLRAKHERDGRRAVASGVSRTRRCRRWWPARRTADDISPMANDAPAARSEDQLSRLRRHGGHGPRRQVPAGGGHRARGDGARVASATSS